MNADKTTNVIGYFNGNNWPVHLTISERGYAVLLQRGEFVVINGQKVNDPILNNYLKPQQLSREISRSGPVPLVLIPAPAPIGERNGPSVFEVKSFTTDARGVRKPVMPQPPAPPKAPAPGVKVNSLPSSSTSSVKAMTMEEARRRGFVGKPRIVSEDYGLTDGENGPANGPIPPIKISVESTPRINTLAALPPELVKADGVPATHTSTSSMLKQNLLETSQPVVAAEAELPAPNLEDAAIPAAPVEESAANESPFVCCKDERRFRTRRHLHQYAIRKWPQAVDEIMAPYPKV